MLFFPQARIYHNLRSSTVFITQNCLWDDVFRIHHPIPSVRQWVRYSLRKTDLETISTVFIIRNRFEAISTVWNRFGDSKYRSRHPKPVFETISAVSVANNWFWDNGYRIHHRKPILRQYVRDSPPKNDYETNCTVFVTQNRFWDNTYRIHHPKPILRHVRNPMSNSTG